MALWSGRFDSEPDAVTFEYGVSFPFDRRLFEDDVTGSLAWAEALAAARVITAAERDTILAALHALLQAGLQDPAVVSGPDEDVHSFVERQLVEQTGDVGRKLHTGRSRNEQVSLDLRLYLRRRIRRLQTLVRDLVGALVTQAETAGDAVMPAYTHLRRAQPVLVAHFLLAHVAAFRRDVERLAAAATEADALPLGSGAAAGTSYPIDVDALARRLGFSRVVANSLDASSDRDFVASFLHACALAMVHLSRLAEDLIAFAGEEFGFVELDDRVSTGSSLMPQKKNPDPLELARGKTGRVIGRVAGWLATLKGLPSGYNKDLQEDKEAVFDAEDTLAASLAAVTSVVGTMRLRADRAAAAASGLLVATEVADYLVARGVPFRRAHEIVGGIVRRLVTEGRAFSDLSMQEWRAFADEFGEDITDVLSPAAAVASKRTPQSTNRDMVARALRETRAWLDSV